MNTAWSFTSFTRFCANCVFLEFPAINHPVEMPRKLVTKSYHWCDGSSCSYMHFFLRPFPRGDHPVSFIPQLRSRSRSWLKRRSERYGTRQWWNSPDLQYHNDRFRWAGINKCVCLENASLCDGKLDRDWVWVCTWVYRVKQWIWFLSNNYVN